MTLQPDEKFILGIAFVAILVMAAWYFWSNSHTPFDEPKRDKPSDPSPYSKMAVQVNGKVCGHIGCHTDDSDDVIQANALVVAKSLYGHITPRKFVIVPKVLINIVV